MNQENLEPSKIIDCVQGEGIDEIISSAMAKAMGRAVKLYGLRGPDYFQELVEYYESRNWEVRRKGLFGGRVAWDIFWAAWNDLVEGWRISGEEVLDLPDIELDVILRVSRSLRPIFEKRGKVYD